MDGPESRKQVLVADADPLFVQNIVHALNALGMDTLTATSVSSVIEKASRLDVDMILVGDRLSDASGGEVCEAVRHHRNVDHIPVVLFSGGNSPSEKIRGYHQGADDCVDKDIDRAELLARMESIWRRAEGTFRSQREDRQRQVIQEMAKIIDQGLVQPYFQPIYLLRPFRLLGLEVLSRPVQTSILTTADELFRAAIKYDTYQALETLCWRKAVDVVSSSTRNEHLFFNCNPRVLEQMDLRQVFGNSQIPFEKLVFEFTESSSFSRRAQFTERLDAYRADGFRFAIDDVGGGYASLETIITAKPEIVKIDVHIVRDLHRDAVKRSIVKFIVSFCRENGIMSVAEGIERKEELEAVAALDVDAVQGYFLFRPTPDLNLRQMRDAALNFS